MSAPERIVTRHYDNGIISAQPADKGFAYNGGNHTHEEQYVRADLSPTPDARQEGCRAGIESAAQAERNRLAAEAKAEADARAKREADQAHRALKGGAT